MVLLRSSPDRQRILYPLAGGIAIVALTTLIGCASNSLVTDPAPAPRPMIASLAPMAAPVPVPERRPAVRVDRTASAASLLDQGIHLLGDEHYAAAAEAFEEAIATGRLNDAGRAFAYWQVFVACEELRDLDRGSDALAGFVVVAEEVLVMRQRLRFAVNTSGDFVDRFGLEEKLRRARAALSAAWAARADHFGRSVDFPVPVHDVVEMEEFLGMVATCDAKREERSQREIARPSGERIKQVTISCDGYEQLAEYFFSVVEEER